jgi:hypothetical protein
MRTRKSNLIGCASLLFPLAVASTSFAQIIIIDSSTRNGSFEEGVFSPWKAAQDSQVIHDPAFNSHGDYYASIQSSLIRPVSIVQNLALDPSHGLGFILSFDARIGSPGLDVVAVGMAARTLEGAAISAIVTPILVPALSSEEWQSFAYELEIPAAWNTAGITFSISFSKNVPLDGISHFGYLDNVVLQQVPEPATWTLLAGGLCGVVAGIRLFRKRRLNLALSAR